MKQKDKAIATATEARYASHEYGDSHWRHVGDSTKTSVLLTAVVLTFGFALVEVAGGLWSNSLALLGDAGHMVTDSMSLLFALVANRIARRGADKNHTFGHGRVEILAAFVNGCVMVGVIGWLVYEAISRLLTPEAVSGETVMGVAIVGLCVNLAVAWSLSRDQKNVNTRAAFLHVMGDLLGSVAAITAGAVIYFGGPTIVDPILSFIVAALLVHATWEILSDAVRVLLDSIPEGVDYSSVGRRIESIPSVNHVHDLHVWTMTAGQGAIQCHVHIDSPECWPRILDAIRVAMKADFGIDHVTVQPEWRFKGREEDCEVCRSGKCPEDFSNPPIVTPEPVLDLTRL